MNRRSFIKSSSAAAAVALLPSWLMPKPIQRIDLTPFCDPLSSTYRYHMVAPFAQAGMIYATDARICVRTLLADADERGDEVRLPNVAGLPWWSAEPTNWKRFPDENLVAPTDEAVCPRCWGIGGFGERTTCPRCDGDGEEFIDYSEDDDSLPCMERCSSCQGLGYWPAVRCDYCTGTGYTSRPAVQLIDGVLLAGAYGARIRTLPNVEFSAIQEPDRHMLLLRFDGGEGMVMGLTEA